VLQQGPPGAPVEVLGPAEVVRLLATMASKAEAEAVKAKAAAKGAKGAPKKAGAAPAVRAADGNATAVANAAGEGKP
jgi:hypothetical protein